MSANPPPPSSTSSLTSLTPSAFTAYLLSKGITSFFVVYDQTLSRTITSHPEELQDILDFLDKDKRDFNNHEGIFVQISPSTGVLQGAFVHRTCRGAAAGGVRNWIYNTVEDFLRDGLRLSRGMTRGIVRGMEAALEYLGKGTLAGKTIVVQGVGHVGKPLVEFLLQKDVARVIGSDIDADIGKDCEETFKASGKFDFVLKTRGDNSILYREGVDIVSPCAVGGILNPETIPNIRAPIVCGAANNQLADLQKDDELLHARGIVYIPDFLVNRMGIVNCADEQYGYVTNDESFERHLGSEWENSIFKIALEVLRQAAHRNTTTQKISLEMAEARSMIPHPIWGHRGVKIVESLVKEWKK